MKEYMMNFEESQEYITKRGFDIPWNDCDVFVDEREMTRTIGNVLKWADKTMIDKVCEWIKEHIDIPYEGRIIDGQPHVMDYIEWAEKRLEYANEIVNSLRQYMEG